MFREAKSKIEAVNRISELTASGAEELGPGSKERKSVLVNLASGIGLVVDVRESKQQIAKLIANKLGGTWTADCESVGQTITLKGLNNLLELALLHFEKVDSHKLDIYDSPSTEAKEILSTFEKFISGVWLGQDAVQQMKDAEYAHWRQTEWQGWYFEFLSLPRLISSLGGKRRKFMNTDFDYSLQRTWDLKAHSLNGLNGKPNNECPLNDKESMDALIAAEGMGLIIINGEVKYEPWFGIWHKALRGKSGPVGRALKSEFIPRSIEIFWIQDSAMKERAIAAKVLKLFKQGHQPDGSPRKVKYQLNAEKARRSELFLAETLISKIK